MLNILKASALDLREADDCTEATMDEIIRELPGPDAPSDNVVDINIQRIRENALQMATDFRRRMRELHSKLNANDKKFRDGDAALEEMLKTSLNEDELKRATRKIHSIPVDFKEVASK